MAGRRTGGRRQLQPRSALLLPINRVVPAHALPIRAAQFFRVRMRTLKMPAVRDAVAIGTFAPLCPQAMVGALKLVSSEPFVSVPIKDDEVVCALLVREGLLKRIDPITLVNFVLRKVKPFMSPSEVLQLDVDLDTVLKGSI